MSLKILPYFVARGVKKLIFSSSSNFYEGLLLIRDEQTKDTIHSKILEKSRRNDLYEP